MRVSTRLIPVMAGALIGSLAAGAAKADDVAAQIASSVGVDGRPVASASSTTELRRVDTPNLEGRNLPGYRTEMSAVEVQHWVNRGNAGVGAGVGSVAIVDRPTGMMPGRFSDGGTVSSAVTGATMMFGLRYRTTRESSVYASATRLSGLGLSSDDRVVSKVGVEFKAKQSNFKIDYGVLGMRFAGDTRMTLKLRRSGVAIGMRRSF